MMNNNVKQEAERLYRCIMHDFHDGKDRQEMWEREIQLVINQQVIQALERAKQGSMLLYIVEPDSGYPQTYARTNATTVQVIDNLIKEYKGDKG